MRDVNDLNGCMSRNIILRRKKNIKMIILFTQDKNNRIVFDRRLISIWN